MRKTTIGISTVKGIENAYILVSGRERQDNSLTVHFRAKATVSFLYDGGEYAAEWEPEYGPIQVWHRCEEDAPNARPHYFYDFTDSPGGNWSQRAVERAELPQAFVAGNFEYIFAVLKDWARGGGA
jgi:hypothetical protein